MNNLIRHLQVVASSFLLLATNTSWSQSTPTVVSIAPSTANAGTNITITGSNFTNTSSVVFGGQSAKFVVQADNKLLVTIPATAATGPIRITAPTGTVLTSAYKVTRVTSSLTFTETSNFAYNPYLYNGGKFALYSMPTFSDLDADGLIDMLVGNGDGAIELYEQVSANSFSFDRRQQQILPVSVGGYATLTVTDLDGNGLLDLLVGNTAGFVQRFEQSLKAGTSFTLQNNNLLGDLGSYSAPTVADPDGDGLLDILVGLNSGYIQHFEQEAPNSLTFNRRTSSTTSFANIFVSGNQEYLQPRMLDVDGDGLLELVIGTYSGNTHYYSQTARNTLSFSSSKTLIPDNGDHATPAFTDLNGDGLLDLVIGDWKLPLSHYIQHAQTPNLPPEDIVLPVLWKQFWAKKGVDGVQLNWSTSLEVESRLFVVERSVNGFDFSPVGKVNASGNTTSVANYQFVDKEAPKGLLSYRLQQVDHDGTATYSKVVTITTEQKVSKITLNVCPNPSTGLVMLNLTSLPAGEVNISIYNVKGDRVKKLLSNGGRTVHLQLRDLPSGVYFVQAAINSITASTQLVIQ